MCAPIVIDTVRRQMTRRTVLGSLGAAAVGTALGGTASAQNRSARLPHGFTRMYDLTHTVSPRFPVYPVFGPLRIIERFTIAHDGFYANELTFNEHTGTHMDGPIHFATDGPTADRIAVERLFAPLAVISIEARAARDPDATVTVDDIVAWERRHDRLPQGAFVAMHSGWENRVSEPARFLNADANEVMHFPGFSGQAARFLTEERDIAGVGVDTLSLDAGTSRNFVAHLTFLPAGTYGVELLANLGTIPPAGATIIVGGPKHEGASGGPARVFAVA